MIDHNQPSTIVINQYYPLVSHYLPLSNNRIFHLSCLFLQLRLACLTSWHGCCASLYRYMVLHGYDGWWLTTTVNFVWYPGWYCLRKLLDAGDWSPNKRLRFWVRFWPILNSLLAEQNRHCTFRVTTLWSDISWGGTPKSARMFGFGTTFGNTLGRYPSKSGPEIHHFFVEKNICRSFLERRMVEKKPLPALLPEGGDPEEAWDRTPHHPKWHGFIWPWVI